MTVEPIRRLGASLRYAPRHAPVRGNANDAPRMPLACDVSKFDTEERFADQPK